MVDYSDPSKGGVAVPSTLNPGTTAYLRYYLIEKPQNELDKDFIDTLYSLDTIGTLTEADNDVLDVLDKKLNKDFCIILPYLSESSKKYSSLFILSGTNHEDAQLHSIITFYCEKVGKKSILVVDAFCSNQLLKKKVDNHGGRILFETINQACKKMKIKQIELESVDHAIPWYLSKGFVHNVNKKGKGLTELRKRISWSSRSPWSRSSSSPKNKKIPKKSTSSPKKKTTKKRTSSPKKPVKKTTKNKKK
jgi:hypothetical protein